MSSRSIVFCWSESDRIPYEINPGDFIICADSGSTYAERLGIKPDFFVGDFDSSVCPETDNKEVLPREKDDTDTMYAVKYCISKGFDEILIAGGIGGREDHTFGAVSVLKYINSKGKQGCLSDGYCTVNIVDDLISIEYDENIKYISVFPSGEKAEGVTIKGLKYEVSDFTLSDDYPIGVSNETVRNLNAEISVKKGKLIVFRIMK